MEQMIVEPKEVSTQVPDAEADVHLQRLLAPNLEEPWFKSIFRSINEFINPVKLPPLELTSKPVPVEELWGFSEGHERTAGLSSVLIHGGIIALIFLIGTNSTVQKLVKEHVLLVAPDISPYQPKNPPKKVAMGGGGGGGDHSPTPPSKGKLPRIAPKQFVPPSAVIENQHPKLPVEPTIIAQPDAQLPQVNMNQYGDPMAKIGMASNGGGSGGGIGTGKGGGVGPGNGAGFGPGSGGGAGGGAFKIGGGVSKPELMSRVEPEYSDEARKAKFQGTVVLFVIVDAKGFARDVKVIRPLGLCLDQKAIDAVLKWKFKPGMKDGKPVPVEAQIEVNFRLL